MGFEFYKGGTYVHNVSFHGERVKSRGGGRSSGAAGLYRMALMGYFPVNDPCLGR